MISDTPINVNNRGKSYNTRVKLRVKCLFCKSVRLNFPEKRHFIVNMQLVPMKNFVCYFLTQKYKMQCKAQLIGSQ